MALGTRYPLKVTIIAAVGAMVGTVAAIMGFSAERKRVSADQLVWIDDENKCKVPNNPALSLSIMAAFLLLAAQISLTVAGGCVCCNPGINKYISPAPLAIKSLILSWAACVTAVMFFFYGAAVSSNHHAKQNPRPMPVATSVSCGYAVNAGVFAGGALITLLATAFAVTYYLAACRIYMSFNHRSKAAAAAAQSNIEIGQPAAGAGLVHIPI
ncbi:unnamed protein product [Sphagnum balticum]